MPTHMGHVTCCDRKVGGQRLCHGTNVPRGTQTMEEKPRRNGQSQKLVCGKFSQVPDAKYEKNVIDTLLNVLTILKIEEMLTMSYEAGEQFLNNQ